MFSHICRVYKLKDFNILAASSFWIIPTLCRSPKVKGPGIYIPPLTRRTGQWPALAIGSAAQLAATRSSNEQTSNPQSAARQTHLFPSQPSSRNVLPQRLTIFSSELPGTNCYPFTYPGGIEGWVDLSTTSVNNLPKATTRYRSRFGGTRTRDRWLTKLRRVELLKLYLRGTGCHLPYWITQR